MSALVLVWLVVTLCFGLVVFCGAPYLPTLQRQQQTALKLLDLPKGSVLYELGCGDGRMLITAARAGYKVVGIELNPLLFVYAWLATWRYRRQIRVRFGSFWRYSLADADAVYVFLLDKYMARLDQKIRNDIKRPIKLISFTFQIPGKHPQAKLHGLYLYQYKPLRVAKK